MAVQTIDSKTTLKTMRSFAITICVASCIIGAFLLFKNNTSGIFFFGFGILFCLTGFLLPSALPPVYKAWMKLAELMGIVMTHVLLAILYYLVFAPLGSIMKLFGHFKTFRNFGEECETYWITRENGDAGKERYEKMF